VRNFCIKYQDRLLYGTDIIDWGKQNSDEFRNNIHQILTTDWKYLTSDKEMISKSFDGKFKGLHLPIPAADKIYRKNAEKWYWLVVRN
jgi:hypothetical protein